MRTLIKIGSQSPGVTSCSSAQRVVKLMLVGILLGTSASAIDTELHGFVDGRAGVRTQNDPYEDDRSLT